MLKALDLGPEPDRTERHAEALMVKLCLLQSLPRRTSFKHLPHAGERATRKSEPLANSCSRTSIQGSRRRVNLQGPSSRLPRS